MTDIPYSELEILFLDVGNTLLSMDFDLVGLELARRGVDAESARLRRGEAACRPAVSAAIRDLGTTGSPEMYRFYLRSVMENAGLGSAVTNGLVEELAEHFHALPTDELWCSMLPGVPEALAGFRERGLRLIGMSNSDGTAERSLVHTNLRSYFEVVHDSALVGYEKPDPRIFTQALEAAGGKPETTLHVGDMYDVDVAGARNAGIHALLLDPYGDWGEVDCATARDLSELLTRLA